MAMTGSNKILAAGIIGFVAGLLYAPRKGSETQAKIKDRVKEMKSEVEDKAKKAKSKLKDMKDSNESPLEKVDRKMDESMDRLVP